MNEEQQKDLSELVKKAKELGFEYQDLYNEYFKDGIELQTDSKCKHDFKELSFLNFKNDKEQIWNIVTFQCQKCFGLKQVRHRTG